MMNFHNNTALTKVLHSLQDNQNGNKDSKEIYESVLVKHFQIIQTFLQKINALYNKQEQFQNSLAVLNEKVEKLETNSKNIHYQFRSTHLMIDKRLNTIGADFKNIQEQFKNLQLEKPSEDCGVSRAQSARLKSRKRKQRKRQRVTNDGYKVVVYSHNDVNSSMNQQEDHLSKNEGLNLRGSCKTLNRAQLNPLQVDSISSSSQQQIATKPEFLSIKKPSILNVKKKGSFPLQSQESSEQSQSQSQSEDDIEEWVKQQIKKEINIISEEFNIKLKQLQNLIRKNIEQIESQTIKKDAFTMLQYQLAAKIVEKTDEVRIGIQNEQILLREEVIALAKQNHFTLEAFQAKIEQKLDSAFFQQSITNLNGALSEQFSKIQRAYANKLQTKKAFDFIQNKLNKLMTVEDNPIKSKKVVGSSEEPCLKINKCQSHKKLDTVSQKSIKDKVQKPEQGGQTFHKSMDTSMWEIQPAENSCKILNEEKSNLNSLLSNISKLKSPNNSGLTLGSNPKEESKAYKSLSTPKKQARLSLTITKAQPVNIRQWRDKVVKILRKQDIRKRKVTFR